MTLNEFICEEQRHLKAFEAWWRRNHQKNPKEFPLEFEHGDEGSWGVQLEAFDGDDVYTSEREE